MGITALVEAADTMLKRGDYASAIPALKEVIVRTQELKSAQGRDIFQSSRFQLARALYLTGDIAAGINLLEKYLAAEPRDQERMALRMLAQGHLDIGQWEKAAEYAGRLLSIPGLAKDDLLNANLLYGQALFRQEKWEECVTPLTYTTEKSKDEKVRHQGQIMMVRALVESKQWTKLFGLVRSIYHTDAKYDITLNITLMHGGKTLFESAIEKDIDEGRDELLRALFLYRMVQPREQLIDFSTRRMAALQAELDKKVRVGITDKETAERQQEIDTIKESVTTLSELPPYEDEVTFRIGQIYAEVKRYWEGYELFNSLYEKDRNSEIGEAAILQSVLILYDVKETDLAEERILRYLDEKPNGEFARALLSMMMRDNLTRENFDRVASLRDYVDKVAEAAGGEEPHLNAELRYLLAFGYFLKLDYVPAGEQFGIIIDKYPDSPSREDCVYFRGMSYMLRGDYQSAIDDFMLYQKSFEGMEHYAAAMFREAVCLFGMEKISEAEAAMTKFIDAYPEDPSVSEAYSMRGDIEGAKDGRDNPETPDIDEYDPHTLDRALADYRQAIDRYQVPSQAAYAAFRSAEVYKLEFKWQEISDLMNYYLNLLGEKADVAQAMFWIGQSQIELGQIEEAVSKYLDAIERFGNEKEQVGVDKIVLGLVQIADRYLSEGDKQSLIVKINLKLSSIDDRAEVLKLRLRTAKAYMEGPEGAAALGAELLTSNQALSSTTPISLALMCDAAVMAGDTEQMGVLYDYFLANFEESDELWHAYRAKLFQLLAEEAYASALKTIDEVQSLFGVESYMGWAQISKADTLYKRGNYEDAEKEFNAIMGVSEWRGGIFAEAMCGMARCRIATEDYETAHSYYQRTYLLYKKYDDGKWAADGYLGAADCLVKLGRNADAVNTLNEMLNDPYVNTLPQADTAMELKKKYGGE